MPDCCYNSGSGLKKKPASTTTTKIREKYNIFYFSHRHYHRRPHCTFTLFSLVRMKYKMLCCALMLRTLFSTVFFFDSNRVAEKAAECYTPIHTLRHQYVFWCGVYKQFCRLCIYNRVSKWWWGRHLYRSLYSHHIRVVQMSMYMCAFLLLFTHSLIQWRL